MTISLVILRFSKYVRNNNVVNIKLFTHVMIIINGEAVIQEIILLFNNKTVKGHQMYKCPYCKVTISFDDGASKGGSNKLLPSNNYD